MDSYLPVGKLPPDLLARLLASVQANDPRLVLGPGIGVDCAVIDFGAQYLVLKSDPITFATDQIGWYLVQVNVNDLATTGATPRWLMATLLLPEKNTTQAHVENIFSQLNEACQAMGIVVAGGHTEVTYGLDRPIVVGTLVGEVAPNDLIRPDGTQPGDRLLLTKGVPIEATALIARELPGRLSEMLSSQEIAEAQNFLFQPGISVLKDAQIAIRAGKVHAMHDPTEGGLAGALWELAAASQTSILFNPQAVPVPELSARICQAVEIDPLAAIASGALLISAAPPDAIRIAAALQAEGIACADIGTAFEGPVGVWQVKGEGRQPYPRPEQDEIARLFAT